MEVIEGAIILAVIAVGGGTVKALQSGEDGFKVYVVLQQFVVFSEAFHKAVGLAVISLINYVLDWRKSAKSTFSVF